jgi:hypothetical protein
MKRKYNSIKQVCLYIIIPLLGISGTSVAQTSGGPDIYGYTWIDSDDPSGPVYNWVDITTTGTLVSGLSDDNSVGPISMPNFEYYGQTVNQLNIGSNGWVAFNSISNIAHCFPSIPIPGVSGDNYLAPQMSDLNFAGAANPGQVYYYDDISNNRFIVSYINVPKWVNAIPDYIGSNTFQIILDRTDFSIYFQYNSMDPTYTDVTGCATDIVVGIENYDGTDGLLHSQETIFQNNYTILFDSQYCTSNSAITETACYSYTSPSGNYTWTSSNTYMDTIQAASGCDSIITISLTINNVSELATTSSGTTITANNTGATYQWLDCDNGNAIIVGETAQSFTASVNGNYAVELTENGCVDTSSCEAIASVGIIENNFGDKLVIYPNPTSGNFSIDLGAIYETSYISITDINGKLVYSKSMSQSQILNISIVEPAGVYNISIQTRDKKATIQLIKE